MASKSLTEMFHIVDYFNDRKALCKWLRDNSSGIYRPAAIAANVIESLQAEVEELRTLLNQGQSREIDSI